MQTSVQAHRLKNSTHTIHSHLIQGLETMTSKSDDNTALICTKKREQRKKKRDLESRRASTVTSKGANPDE